MLFSRSHEKSAAASLTRSGREASVARYREIAPGRLSEFFAGGYKARHVFAHQIYYLPKCGPDGLQLARAMCGSCKPDQLTELVLYAHPSCLGEFPRELFFDKDLCWHQQQFGKPGQIATANLLRRGAELYTMVHQSDLVQRAKRAPRYRTRLQNRFKGWNYMLLNGILNFAVEQQVKSVYLPTAQLALRHTDRKRDVRPELFERIYDQQPRQIFALSRVDAWWKLDVEAHRALLIRPESKSETLPSDKVICLCHDVERGLGHLDDDPPFAELAGRAAPQHLKDILDRERRSSVKATYNVVGQLLPELRGAIEADGHCLGFHSYDHRDFTKSAQLGRCREIDYRLKGYRPPQSKITRELNDENLLLHNFEWLASSGYSLGIRRPELHHGLVKIPIAFHDWDLYRGSTTWEAWEQQALRTIEQSEFLAFSMHDCYGGFWLPHYERFLEKVGALGTFKTLDEVLNLTIMSHAV